LSSALRGFSSIGYSGPNNTPNNWGNIYANVVGIANGYSVLGNCAALDQALDQVLGPDPTPCDQRGGPPVGQTTAPSGGPNGTGGGSGQSLQSGLTGAPGNPSAPGGNSSSSTSTNPLTELLSPLLGGKT